LKDTTQNILDSNQWE